MTPSDQAALDRIASRNSLKDTLSALHQSYLLHIRHHEGRIDTSRLEQEAVQLLRIICGLGEG